MAAKEHQGYLIAVIVLTMLTIALLVSTYLFYKNLDSEQAKTKALTEQVSKANQAKDAADNDSKEMKKLLGSKADDTVAQVQDQYTKDMKAWGESFPEAQFKQDTLNYRHWVQYLHTELRGAKARIAKNAQTEAELNAKLQAVTETQKKESEKYKAMADATAAELKGEHDKFLKDRDDFKKNTAKISKDAEARNEAFVEYRKKSEAEKTALEKQNQKLAEANAILTRRDAESKALAERAVGQITRVNQTARTVWLNLGSLDGLRRQTSFSVVGADETDPTKAKGKGSIEVTRVLDAHMAEARIVDDKFENPLMTGDQLFSPVWHPGRTEHFAIAGFIDIDGDKKSDQKLVRNLIQMNSGVVDAYVDEEGKKVGEITANTKYLVLGAPPEEKKDSELVQSYSKLIGESDTLGVRKMSVREFLDYMGYAKGERTVALGKGAVAEDFPPKPPGEVVRKSNNEMFRPRRATPTGNTKSAY